MESGVRTVAKGHFVTVNPRPSTRAEASVALGWSEDSIDRLERGDDPIISDPAPAGLAATVAGLAEHIDRLDGEVAGLRRAIEELRGPSTMERAAEGAGPAGRESAATGGRRVARPRPTPESGDHATE